MALNTYGGFSQGFQQGFGLMESAQNRKLKEEQLENAEETQALDEQFRRDQLQFQRDQEANTQAYRKKDLEYKEQAAQSSAELNALKAQIELINANTASTKANTANLEAKQQEDPNSLTSLKKQAEIDKQQADIDKTKEETNQKIKLRTQEENAVRLDRMYKTALRAKNDPLTNTEIEAFRADQEALTGQGRFDLGFILNPQKEDSFATIDNVLRNLASGGQVDMTPEVVGAFDDVLGIGKSAAVGRTLDDSFVNAPDWMKDGKHRIVSQGLHEIGSFDGKTFGGTMYVLVENTANGKVYPYFPPLTSNRSMRDNQPLSLTLDEAMQASAGTAYMIRNIAPVLKEQARDARIFMKYGENGVEKFNADVDRKLEAIRKAIHGGSNPQTLIMFEGMQDATQTEKLGLTQTYEFLKQLEHDILYGAENKKEDNMRVDEWFKETSASLNNAPMPKGYKKNLGQIIQGNWTPQNVSTLQGYYNPDGTISDEQGLLNALRQLQFIQ